MSSSLSAPVIVPVTTERPYQPVLFDPDGEVKTSDRLNAQWDEVRGPMLNNYVRYHLIGKGQHGEVYLCKRLNHTKAAEGVKARHIPVAMKSIRRDNPRAQQWKKLRRGRLPASADHTPMADKLNTVEAKIKREIAIMKKLIHPQVVRLYEVIDDRMASKIYMVMEYLGGGEVKWTDANKNPVLTTTQSRRILRDALLGLEYLHFQGIIHRDIKPANLLWTEDRRQVKIADFGVSHFSYAQRLAAGAAAADEDPYDPILLDESGLTKRAGTPAFYAPEVIYEHTYGIPGSISSSNSTAMQSASSLSSNNNLSSPLTPPGELERPPITKAIDVWALGATFYCFLTGRTPFDAAVPGSEFSLYGCICNEDWTIPPTLGADKIPSGGRIPVGDSEGATIVRLLDHFLQKDQTKRVTLAEVKRHPWTLKDLHDPETWLRITSPRPELIAVSSKETSDAMSAVHFRWRWGGKLARHVSSLFRSGNAASDAGAGGAPETPAPAAGRTLQLQGIVDGAAPPNVGRNPAHTTKQQYKNKEKERNRNGHEDNYPSAAVSESGQPRWRTPTSPSHQHPTGTTSSTVPLLADSSKSYSASSSKTNGKGKEKEKEKEKATTLSPIAKQASSKKLSATGASSPPRQTTRRGSVSRTIERVASGSRSLFASGNPPSAGAVATYSNASASGGFITGAPVGNGQQGNENNGINGSSGGGGGSGGTTPTSDKRARLIGLLQHISTWRPTKFNGGSSSPGAGANGRGGSGYEQLASHVRSVGGGGGRREGAPRGEGGTGKGKAKMTTNQRGDLPGPSRNLRRSEEALRSYRTPNAAGAGVNYNYNSYSYKNNGGSNYENGASTNHGGEDRKPNTANNNNNVDLNTATSNNNNNALTAAQRASSWGPLEDLTAQAELISVQSVEQMMMLNDHTMTVGAGGLAEEPIPPIPPVSSAEMVAKFGRFGFGVGGSSSSPGAAGGASGSGDAVAAGVSANGADEGGGDEKEWDDSVLLDSESSFSTRYGALIMSDDDFSSLHSFDAGASVHQGGQLVGGGVGLVGASGSGGGGGGGGVPEVVVVGGGRGGLLPGPGPAPVVVSRSITAAAVDAGVDVDEDRQSGSSVWHDGASLEEEDGDEFEEEDDDEYSLEEEQGVTFSPRPKRRHVVDVVDDDDDDDEGDGDEEEEEEEEEEERMVEEERRRVK